jgi:hypothetical protein
MNVGRNESCTNLKLFEKRLKELIKEASKYMQENIVEYGICFDI